MSGYANIVRFSDSTDTGPYEPVSLTTQEGLAAWKCFTCGLEIVEQGEGASARADAAKIEHDKFCDGLTP